MRDNKLIQLYITNMCNSHCKTCSIWKNERRQELTCEIEKVFMAFPDADFIIGGGEAILHNNIEHILGILKFREIKYTLLSNCIHYKKLCHLISKYDIPAVTVSCDGINHDDIRGVKGNLLNICRLKSFCNAIGTKFKISYTYSKYNEKTFLQDMDMFKDVMGLNEIYFCIAQDMDLLHTQEVDENFVANDFEQILHCGLISLKDKKHIKGMVTGVRRVCSSQNNVHTIYSNGDIVRCQSFRSKEILGNIKNMSVDEIRDTLNSIQNESCIFDSECNLLCQRRYD